MLYGYRQLYSLHKNISPDIEKDAEVGFDTSNYQL